MPARRFSGRLWGMRAVISLDEFRAFYDRLPYHAEIEIAFEGRERCAEYMIIKYEDGVSFQRCGYRDGSGELEYGDLEALLKAETVDGICLERDLPHATLIEANGYIRLIESAAAE